MFNLSGCDYPESGVHESSAKPNLGLQFGCATRFGLVSTTTHSGQSSLEQLSLLLHVFSANLPPDLRFSMSLIICSI